MVAIVVWALTVHQETVLLVFVHSIRIQPTIPVKIKHQETSRKDVSVLKILIVHQVFAWTKFAQYKTQQMTPVQTKQ